MPVRETRTRATGNFIVDVNQTECRKTIANTKSGTLYCII